MPRDRQRSRITVCSQGFTASKTRAILMTTSMPPMSTLSPTEVPSLCPAFE